MTSAILLFKDRYFLIFVSCQVSLGNIREKEEIMGAGTAVLEWIYRVVRGERPESVVREQVEDPFLARSLQLDEDMRTGKSRTLSVEETKRELKRLKRGAR